MSLVQFGHGLHTKAPVDQPAVHFCGAHCVQHQKQPETQPRFGGDSVHFCGGNCAQHGA